MKVYHWDVCGICYKVKIIFHIFGVIFVMWVGDFSESGDKPLRDTCHLFDKKTIHQCYA